MHTHMHMHTHTHMHMHTHTHAHAHTGKLDADDLEFMLDESKRQNPGSAATEGELRGWAWARERRY